MTKNPPKGPRNLYIEEVNSDLDKKDDVNLKSMVRFYLENTSELDYTRMS